LSLRLAPDRPSRLVSDLLTRPGSRMPARFSVLRKTNKG
jgi:hypothetical protein